MLIGISGKKQSGKDTVCKIIQYLYYFKSKNLDIKDISDFMNDKNLDLELLADYTGWKRKSFADKLKDIVCLLIGCKKNQLEDNEFKTTSLGEEWIRYGYADGFWSHSSGDPLMKIMENTPCSKEKYEQEKATNWQTAYKSELTPRLLLQLLGTECGRNIIHPNIWVNALMNEYKNQPDKVSFDLMPVYPNWIITDVRFPNEAAAIEAKNGILIRIERKMKFDRTCFACNKGFEEQNQLQTKLNLCPHCDGINHAAVTYEPDTHSSETSLDDHYFEHTIINDGSLEDLVVKVEALLKKLNLL